MKKHENKTAKNIQIIKKRRKTSKNCTNEELRKTANIYSNGKISNFNLVKEYNVQTKQQKFIERILKRNTKTKRVKTRPQILIPTQDIVFKIKHICTKPI
jgi:hypothetical protein